MLIDQVFLYFLIGVGVVVSLPALWLLMRARWPQRVDKLREVAGRSVILSFLLGLPLLGIVIGLVVGIARLGQRGDIVPVVVLSILGTVMMLAALAGTSGLAALIGERLAPGPDVTDLRKMTVGGIVLSCLISMPYVGWFVLLPVCIITGAGMMLRSVFVRAKHPAFGSAPAPQMATPPPLQGPAQTA